MFDLHIHNCNSNFFNKPREYPKSQLTVGVSGWWAGWENAREQEKPEAGKMLINRAESRQSTARFVRPL
jgi:hypothetical protein